MYNQMGNEFEEEYDDDFTDLELNNLGESDLNSEYDSDFDDEDAMLSQTIKEDLELSDDYEGLEIEEDLFADAGDYELDNVDLEKVMSIGFEDADLQLESPDVNTSSKFLEKYTKYQKTNPLTQVKNYDIACNILVRDSEMLGINIDNFESVVNPYFAQAETSKKIKKVIFSKPEVAKRSVQAFIAYEEKQISIQNELVNKLIDSLIGEFGERGNEALAKVRMTTQAMANNEENLKNRGSDKSDGHLLATKTLLESKIVEEGRNLAVAKQEYMLAERFLTGLKNTYNALYKPTNYFPSCSFVRFSNMKFEIINLLDGLGTSTHCRTECNNCSTEIKALPSDLASLDLKNDVREITLLDCINLTVEALNSIFPTIKSTMYHLLESGLMTSNLPLKEEYLKLTDEQSKASFLMMHKSEIPKSTSYNTLLPQLQQFVALYNDREWFNSLLIDPSEMISANVRSSYNLDTSVSRLLSGVHPLLRNSFNNDIVNDGITATSYNKMTSEEKFNYVHKNLEHSILNRESSVNIPLKSETRMKFTAMECPNCKTKHLLPYFIYETVKSKYVRLISKPKSNANKNSINKTITSLRDCVLSFEDALAICSIPHSRKIEVSQQSQGGEFMARKMKEIHASNTAKKISGDSTEQSFRKRTTSITTNVDMDTAMALSPTLQRLKTKYGLVNDILAQRIYVALKNTEQQEVLNILAENDAIKNTETQDISIANQSGFATSEPTQQVVNSVPVIPNLPDAPNFDDLKEAVPDELMSVFKEYYMSQYTKPVDEMYVNDLTTTGFYKLENLERYYNVMGKYPNSEDLLYYYVRENVSDDYEQLPKILREYLEEEFITRVAEEEDLKDFFIEL